MAVQEESPVQPVTVSPFQKGEELVTRLYDFNSHYFETHDISSAGGKAGKVARLLEETLEGVLQLEDSISRAQYQYLRGWALNVLPDYNPEAEQLLSQAVKVEPGLVGAWNCLGECYWRAGKVHQAQHCFAGALKHKENKMSLRCLSMVLRQIANDASEKERNVKESVEIAKKAVSLDIKDGISWMILGNAYLSQFFTVNQEPQLLKLCSSAYAQAMKDIVALNNPDLHFNLATLLLYEEKYSECFSHLERACQLDPEWNGAREKLQSVKAFIQKFSGLVIGKGKLKPKKLQALVNSLQPTEKFLGSKFSKQGPVGVKALLEQKEVQEEGGQVLVAVVTVCFSPPEGVPIGCVLVDSEGASVGMTVYNLTKSFHFSTGDVLTIPNPCLQHICLPHLEVDYHNIRCTSPQLLLCNGCSLSQDKLSSSVICVTAFS